MNYIKLRLGVFISLLWLGAVGAQAAPHYVMPTNAAALWPFDVWTNAATNIQDAVNAAVDGETVWLTNGAYFCQGVSTCIHTWGGANIYTNTAMVVITNSIIVRSVNGYTNTLVDGNYPAYTTRVFLLNSTGVVVSGLTITNGFIVTNPFINAGAGVYMRGGLVSNCLITGNTISNPFAVKFYGSGIAMDTGYVSHCVIKGNISTGALTQTATLCSYGENQAGCRIVSNCVIADNYNCSQSPYSYFGYYGGTTMTWCNISGTTGYTHAVRVVGSYSYLEYCVISNTKFAITAADKATIRNCLIVNNVRGIRNSASDGLKVRNCTIANNSQWGMYLSDLSPAVPREIGNCVIYNNGSSYSLDCTNNWFSTNISYTNCCSYPAMPGTNNITNEPVFVDTNVGNWRLRVNSPCANAGMNQDWMTNAVDLDGRARIRYGTVDIGTYEMIYEGAVYRAH